MNAPLSALDESLLHQMPLTFEHAGTSDHRFFDRMILGGFHPDGDAALIVGMGVYKNMNVIDGFVMAQSHRRRQYNVRFSQALRPLHLDLTTRIGPLQSSPLEPLRRIHVSLQEGEYPVSLDMEFQGVLPPRLEAPHTGRLDGRLHTDYLRFHQLGEAAGWLNIDGERFEVGKWFAWRDRSWGIRPFVGGFEPMTGTSTGGGLPSALRSGTKDIMVVHVGFWNGAEGGGIQFIEDGTGKRLYSDGVVGRLDKDGHTTELVVTTLEHDLRFHPGTRVVDTLRLKLTLSNSEMWEVECRAVGRPWVYQGGGYDRGYFDGLGHGVWRSEDLLIEQDVYDISDIEAVVKSDGSVVRPSHREQFSQAVVNGVPGFSYSPCIVIGRHPRYNIG
jgi:hypothetical protein